MGMDVLPPFLGIRSQGDSVHRRLGKDKVTWMKTPCTALKAPLTGAAQYSCCFLQVNSVVLGPSAVKPPAEQNAWLWPWLRGPGLGPSGWRGWRGEAGAVLEPGASRKSHRLERAPALEAVGVRGGLGLFVGVRI